MITWSDSLKCAFYQLSKPMSRKNFHPCLLIFDSNALLIYKTIFNFILIFISVFIFKTKFILKKVLAASENL